MEERESLKRQIELLQNLIKNHSGGPSSAQQNVAPGSQGAGHDQGAGSGDDRGPSSGHASGHFSHMTAPSQPYPTLPAGSWRKTYSLNNRGSGDTAKGVAVQTETQTQTQTKPHALTHTNTQSLAAPKAVTAPQASTNFQTHTSPHKVASVLTVVKAGGPAVRSQPPASAAVKSAAPPQIGPQPHLIAKPKAAMSVAQSLPSSSSSSLSKSNLKAAPAPAVQLKTASISHLKSHPAKSQPTSAPLKKSQYRWVKSQQTSLKAPVSICVQPASSTTSLLPQPSSKSSAGVSPKTITPHTPSRTASLVPPQSSSRKASSPSTPLSQRSAVSSGRPRTSKYTWVSHATSGTKLARKPLSPRALQAPSSLPPAAEGIRARKLRGKGGGSSGAVASQGRLSRYSWRAEATATAAGKGSVYRWTPQKDRGPKAAAFTLTSVTSPGAFKLRSRMKIIRKSPGSRQVQPPVRALQTRSLALSRRGNRALVGGNRALVSIGRHKLRLASPGARSTTAFYFSGPAAQPVHSRVRTRYRIDARRWHTLSHSHPSPPSTARSWRARRVQSARMLLQNRLRGIQERHWRGRRMRWIGGELYQVSPNKISRTQAPTNTFNRTGRRYSRYSLRTSTSPTAANLYKTSSTRHVASRVVQRSLAIIRQAGQKKQQQARQYCMYYNRFGKCNRGASCPYIHDPDKVAVCTRFLRGTCKQTDGTCPFSHRVSREKMPVCSYYLRGICNNSSCPYSHVYVSRKAAVCQDFLRGYCPQGEKCKKKHTLMCPDFSASGVCPRGSKCKLKHRLRKTAISGPGTQSGPRIASGAGVSTSSVAGGGGSGHTQNRKTSAGLPAPPTATHTHSAAATKRPEQKQASCLLQSPSVPPQSSSSSSPSRECAGEGDSILSSSSTPRSLPSFIALPSSPEDGVPPDTPTHPLAPPTAQGKKLHIKPRF